jgi:hypothetical protein
LRRGSRRDPLVLVYALRGHYIHYERRLAADFSSWW